MAGYGDDTGFNDWLASNGFSLPVGSSTPAQLRQVGSTHVDAHDFPGAPAGGFAQERAWPRSGATAYQQDIPDDVIPWAIEQASYAAGYFEAKNPGALTTRSSADQRVKRERVEGVVDKEFFDGGADGAANEAVTIPMVEGMLAPFLAGDEPAVSLGILALG